LLLLKIRLQIGQHLPFTKPTNFVEFASFN
jgi:hypothetical protein